MDTDYVRVPRGGQTLISVKRRNGTESVYVWSPYHDLWLSSTLTPLDPGTYVVSWRAL